MQFMIGLQDRCEVFIELEEGRRVCDPDDSAIVSSKLQLQKKQQDVPDACLQIIFCAREDLMRDFVQDFLPHGGSSNYGDMHKLFTQQSREKDTKRFDVT